MEFLPLVLIAILFWLLVIRPQRKRNVQQERLRQSLETGQDVVTVGGVFGTLRQIDEHEVLLEIAPGTTVRVDKRAVVGRVEEDRR